MKSNEVKPHYWDTGINMWHLDIHTVHDNILHFAVVDEIAVSKEMIDGTTFFVFSSQSGFRYVVDSTFVYSYTIRRE